jgi:peptide/nickel transport system substrate-binding protein
VQAGRGGLLILAGGAVLLAAATAAVIAIASAGGRGSEPAAANSVAVIDPESNEVTANVPTGVRPTDVSAESGAVWVANTGDDSVTHIDPKTRAAVSTTSPGSNVDGLAAGAGAVWIAASRGSELVRLDPVLHAERSIRLAPAPDPFPLAPASPVAAGDGAVWAIKARREIARIDPGRHKVVAQVAGGNNPTAVAIGARASWVADADDNTVIRIGPGVANAVTATTPVGQEPSAITVGEGAVWVANTQDGTVARIEPSSASVIETIPVGGRPTGIAAGNGAVWVANSLEGTVSRIDPDSNEVVATVDVGEAPQGLAVTHGLVWVSVQAAAEPAPPPAGSSRSDVARLLWEDLDPGSSSTDPALVGNYQIGFATCALLYNYPDRPYPAGSRLRPEVAAGRPLVSNGGRKYTFEIRSGFRFSPPSNEPVTAAAFQRAIERALNPRMNGYGGGLVREIAGAKAYAAGRTHRVSGVSAQGDRLAISLTRPVPNLTARLSAQYFCAVPPGTPVDPEGVEELPSAGPYYVASHEPGESLVLRRNPSYGGSRPQDLSEISFTFGTPQQRAIEDVEAGNADYVNIDPLDVAPTTMRRLDARYGPQSEAARAGRQQLFTEPNPSVFSFVLNTRRGPFRDVRLRRARNYAIDRRALAVDTGVSGPGRPTDQYIPPGFPGFEDAPIYPLGGPQVATARRLAGDLKRKAMLYTCDEPGCARNAEILRSNLRAIGIDLEVRQYPLDEMFRREFRAGEPWDIGMYGWEVDYGDPYNFINTQFAAGAERPGTFHDPRFERRMEATARLTGRVRLRAYGRLDRDLAAEAAPQATFASGESSYFLSARMGCEVPHPIYASTSPPFACGTTFRTESAAAPLVGGGPLLAGALPARAGGEFHEPWLVELVPDDRSGAGPVVDVERVVGNDAAVVDERPHSPVMARPAEQPTGERAAIVVVPGGVLADDERPVVAVRVAPVAVEAAEGRPDARRCELRVDVGPDPVDVAASRPVVPGSVSANARGTDRLRNPHERHARARQRLRDVSARINRVVVRSGAVDAGHALLGEPSVDRRPASTAHDQHDPPPGVPERARGVARAPGGAVRVERAVRVPVSVHLREQPQVDHLARPGDQPVQLQDVVITEAAGDPARADQLRLAARCGRDAQDAARLSRPPPVQPTEHMLSVPVAEAFEQGRMRADPAVEPPVVPRQAGVGDAMEDPVVRRDKGRVGSAAPVSLRGGGGGQSQE